MVEPVKQNKFDGRLNAIYDLYKKSVKNEDAKLSALQDKLGQLESAIAKRQKTADMSRKGQELKILENNANLEVI